MMANADIQSKATLQVIVAGLPRTGTTSMTRALEILLDGKVFDGGAVSYNGNARVQQQMLELARHCPMKTPVDRTFIQYRLAQLTEGCVASSDQPGCYFIEELLQLYPEAKVIVTTRDRGSWWESYSALWGSLYGLYPWCYLVPQMRRFCTFTVEFWRRVPQAVGIAQCEPWPMSNQEGLFEAHAAYVRRVVPQAQLFYFDVKSGWKPLCEILGVPVPNEPFPHIFPRSWLERGKTDLVAKSKRRVLVLLGAAGFMAAVSVYASRWFLQRRLL